VLYTQKVIFQNYKYCQSKLSKKSIKIKNGAN